MSRVILAEPISRVAYAPYGSVLSATEAKTPGRSANHGTAMRHDGLSELENLRAHARPNVCLFRATPTSLPFTVRLLEKHPHSTQMFVPMNASRYLVVVARELIVENNVETNHPDESDVRAFVAAGPCGITYRAGVWHHPLIALDHVTDFVGLVWEDGTDGDCTEVSLDEVIEVAV
jgi:ureidoglycolate lyase